MSSILDKAYVIKLNKLWQAYDIMTIGETFTFLCSLNNGQKPGFAIDYDTVINAAGEHELVYTNVVSLEEWMKLPIKPGDLTIGIGVDKETGIPRQVRVPKIVICANYAEVPKTSKRHSTGNVLERDGYTCQYTGKKLPRHRLNVDHVIPRDKGGKDTWENTVACDTEINTRKGNRYNHEIGLKLIRKPVAPKATVKLLKASDAKDPSQVPFLLK